MDQDGVFDASVAATYDTFHDGNPQALEVLVARLKELAEGGAALEFAIGTGRIALPLQTAGVPVSGIELSSAMVDELRKKESDAPIDVVVGDMTFARAAGHFSLVFLVYNTIDNLTSQDAQVACFQNAAAHLDPGGRFVIETLVPPIQKLAIGETHLAHECSETHWGIDTFDLVTQKYASHHMHIADGGAQQLTVPFRYAWPAEFDLMARIAGMTLEHRWSDWSKSPFTATSRSHVSVWRKMG